MASGKATIIKSRLKYACEVSLGIQASPQTVWALMTNSAKIPQWNSTIIGMEGAIMLGQTLKIRSTLDVSRTFIVRVTAFDIAQKMVWEDGFSPTLKSTRTFLFSSNANNGTIFTIREVVSGFMLPRLINTLPDYGLNFEQFAHDLKTAAEAG